MVKIAPLSGSFNIGSPDCLIKRTKKIPEISQTENVDALNGSIPEWHNVKSGHEDKNMNVRDSSEELSRPELRHILGKGVEILRRKTVEIIKSL